MEQYIRINKLLKDKFGQHLKFIGKFKPIQTPIDEFYAILDKFKEKKMKLKIINGHNVKQIK